jgi:hypothetical protein
VLVDYSRLTAGTLGKGDVAVATVSTGAPVNLTDSNGIDEGHADWQP